MPNHAALRERLSLASVRRGLLSAGVVASLTVTGFFLPGLLLAPGFKGFSSHASVAISEPQVSSGNVERAARKLRESLLSPVALSIIASDLGLRPDDLFGTRSHGYVSVLLDLLAGGGQDASPIVGATEEGLEEAVSITPVPEKARVDVDVLAANAEASQKIAQYFAARIVKEIGGGADQSSLGTLEMARLALDSAEAALSGFQMRHGDDAVSHIQNLQQKIREDDAARAALKARQTELEDAMSFASSMKVSDVLNRSLPALAAFEPLEAVNQSYTAAKLALADVSVDHGPRHPRTIAAQATVDAVRTTAMPALRRVQDALKQEHASVLAATENQTRLRVDLDAQMAALGDAPSDLAKRQAALEKARRDYIISSETAGSISTSQRMSASLATPANPGTPDYDGFTANAMAVAGAFAGLLTSLLLLSFRREEKEREEQEQEQEDATPSVLEIEPVAMVAEGEEVVADAIEIEPAIFEDVADEQVEQQTASQMVADEPDAMEAAPSDNDDEAQETATIHAEPANDIPLDERVRQVLIDNAVPSDRLKAKPPEFKLPPLLAAALAGEATHDQAETEELRALRQELALLRARLVQHDMRREQKRNRA
ncbi:hypothetical protein [Agrobacterium sp. fls2-241-TYG-188a]|uniref:hypothetical protein n=1 Tax=Agrobacterium sp. fls2-241-TYG-188a TaxID=3040275 RepID=UPI00254FEE16|nr:hypothetical protein [Agrobacterium sp. fls2-241-TYG-188a]